MDLEFSSIFSALKDECPKKLSLALWLTYSHSFGNSEKCQSRIFGQSGRFVASRSKVVSTQIYIYIHIYILIFLISPLYTGGNDPI